MQTLSALQATQIAHPIQRMTLLAKQRLHHSVHSAVKNRNYGHAIHLLSYLIAQEPCNADYYSNRGLLYYRCQQWPQALTDYTQALRLNPSGDRIYSSRAKCNATIGDWHQAIADYDCAIDINPYNLLARLEQGILLRNLKMYDDAIICFDLALFFGNLQAHVYAERGRTYHLNGHWNCAIGDYQRALSLLDKAPKQALVSKIRYWIAELIPQ